MKKIMRYVGMDVHAETIAIAVVEPNPSTFRPVQSPEQGTVVEVTEGGGLYQHYERLAA
jgi:hypothetical protein